MRIGTTAQFVGGEKLPYDREVEYLENTNNGAYLKFDFTIYSVSSVAVSLMPLSLTNTEYYVQSYFGSSNNGSRADSLYASSNTTFSYVNYNRYVVSIPVTSVLNEWHSITRDRTSVTLDGETYSVPMINSSYDNMCVMSVGRTNWPQPRACRLASCNIQKTDGTVYDLIPVVKDNVGYMYDRISGALIGNAGSGAFTWAELTSASNGGGYKRKCVRRSHTRSLPRLRRFCARPLWKEAA